MTEPFQEDSVDRHIQDECRDACRRGSTLEYEAEHKRRENTRRDESLEFLERQALVYREMALTWGLRIVDANSSLAEIADGLTHEVLAEFYRCSYPSGTPHPSPRLAYPGQASGGTG